MQKDTVALVVSWRSIDGHVLERLRLHGRTFGRDAFIVAVAYVIAELVRFDGVIPAPYPLALLFAFPLIVLVHSLANWQIGIHRRLWEHAGADDLRAVVIATAISGICLLVLDLLLPAPRPLPVSAVPMGAILTLGGLLSVRLWRHLLPGRVRTGTEWERVLVVGAGQAGRMVVSDLVSNPHWKQFPVAILDDDPAKLKMRVHGIPVLGGTDRLAQIAAKQKIDIIAIAVANIAPRALDAILLAAQASGARVQIIRGHAESLAGKAQVQLRDLDLDDVLDRNPAAILDDPMIRDSIKGRVVLVTGARGSIGFEIARQLLTLEPAKVLALDNNETGLFYLQRELRDDPNVSLLQTVLADIAQPHKLRQVFERYHPEIVFHAAAYKHVPMLEDYPEEGIFVNVVGTLNLCRLATLHGCERFVFISTDKAVHPVNVLGYSKRIGEFITRAHNGSRTEFCSVRFGNVLASRGSAVPEFVRQIDAGGPVRITHPDVERYFMTIAEAVSLVIRAAAQSTGGELFMLDMGKPIRVADVVHRLIRLRGLRVDKDVKVVYSGLRAGEKLTEELVFDDEQVHLTSSPSIYRIQDDIQPLLSDLECDVSALVQAATHADQRFMRSLLAEVASGERNPRERHLLVAG